MIYGVCACDDDACCVCENVCEEEKREREKEGDDI